ncbi:MAG: YidC/Oxa1 family membrane protein insertase [Lachnoclostridium sp.]|jgi:YidC/Oxa1 family membrane protein insertase|nr:YidC/Oxa1 family membrane protein insertase [Lachnoclostridium sp.]
MDWLFNPIAIVLGTILEYTDKFVYFVFNIHDTGICIIIFTFLVNMIMFPLTLKQQKTTKVSALMNPEIQAIQAKYKGKKDNASMQAMQREQQAVYDKYGVSPLGGCLPLLIQMPILFALFRVINNIPGYVESLEGFTLFLGIELSKAPYVPWSSGWDRSIIIPILAIITQFISTKFMMASRAKNGKTNTEMPGASSMKAMNNIMPIVSGIFCLSVNAGVGLYWISGNIIRAIQAIFINRHFDKIDIEKVIEENKEKAASRSKKREAVSQKLEQYSKTRTSGIKSNQEQSETSEVTEESDAGDKGEMGSIASYAHMLSGSNQKDKK